MTTETSVGAGQSPVRTVVYLARHGQTPLNESDELRGLGESDALPQDNGCFNLLEWQADRWAILKLNELPVAT